MTPWRIALALLLLPGAALAQPRDATEPTTPPPVSRRPPPPLGEATDARALVAGAVLPGIAARCLPAAGDPPPGGWNPPPPRAAATRVVVAVDASGSMAGRVAGAAGGEVKMEAARRAARRFLEGLGPEVEVGFVVFGHRGGPRSADRAASCAAAETVVPLSSRGRDAALSAVANLRPVGWTPLAAAMRAAAREFRPAEVEGEQLLLVISDGIETCDGDPAAVAREINAGPTRAVVDIVGFDIPGRDRPVLGEVSRAGRGTFAPVADSASAALAMRRSVEGRLGEVAAAQPPAALPPAPGDSRRDLRFPLSDTAAVASCVAGALAEEVTRLEVSLARPGTPPPTAASARALLEERHRAVRAGLSDLLAAMGGPPGPALAAARERLSGILTVFAR